MQSAHLDEKKIKMKLIMVETFLLSTNKEGTRWHINWWGDWVYHADGQM